MAGGGNRTVAGGMNLSTPTVAGPNGIPILGMPQTSQLSPTQSAYGALTGNQNYQIQQPSWMQAMQQFHQPALAQPQTQGQQGKGGNAQAQGGQQSALGAAKNVMGIMSMFGL